VHRVKNNTASSEAGGILSWIAFSHPHSGISLSHRPVKEITVRGPLNVCSPP
jgi:hypothetical protein